MYSKLLKGALGAMIFGASVVPIFAMDAMSGESLNRNLGVGSRDEQVIILQKFLGIRETGFFGNITKQALRNYQQENNILATGFFGPKTRNHINKRMSMGMSMHNDTSAGVMVGGAAMLPNRDIVDNAVLAKNVTTVVAAVKAAGLVDTLKSTGPFTVFAPNNDAFAALPEGTVDTLLKVENKSKLVDILTYHVVAGRYTLADIKDGMILKTVEGKTLVFKVVDGKVLINGTVGIQTGDVISSNGVTHVITGVLLP